MTRLEAIRAIRQAYECIQRETMSLETGCVEVLEFVQALKALGVNEQEIIDAGGLPK